MQLQARFRRQYPGEKPEQIWKRVYPEALAQVGIARLELEIKLLCSCFAGIVLELYACTALRRNFIGIEIDEGWFLGACELSERSTMTACSQCRQRR